MKGELSDGERDKEILRRKSRIDERIYLDFIRIWGKDSCLDSIFNWDRK